MSHPTRHANRGFSLVEVCCGMAISSVLLSQAVPGMQQIKQRRALEGVAQTLYIDLQQARSEAVERAAAVQLRFSQHTGGSCYVIHTGASGECRCEPKDGGAQAVCGDAAQALKVEWLPANRKLTLRSNVAAMNFQARQGLVTSTGSIDVLADNGESIRHVVSIAGRVRTCSPAGALRQFPKC